MVDVGWKTEGFIPIKELKDAQGNVNISVGDDIEVFIDKRERLFLSILCMTPRIF